MPNGTFWFGKHKDGKMAEEIYQITFVDPSCFYFFTTSILWIGVVILAYTSFFNFKCLFVLAILFLCLFVLGAGGFEKSRL